jgi:hypothetical protein
MSSSVIFFVLVMCQPTRLFAQKEVTIAPKILAQGNSADLPKPAVDPTAGSWKYKETDVVPHGKARGTYLASFSVTVKDDGGVWTVTSAWKSDLGPVTDVSTYEKGTLVLRKELFDHFLHKDQPWKPVAINLDFNGNKVTGIMKYVDRPDKPVTMDLGGPAFASATPDLMIGCLPLADGYSTTFRYFDVDRLPIKPQASNKLVRLKVVGMERVTVPAGTFDTYRVELTSADGGSNKETVWIAKDLRIPVRTSGVDELYGVITTELVP